MRYFLKAAEEYSTGIGGTLTHIAVIKKHILSRNLDQNMLKNALLFGKSWKNRPAPH